MTIQEILTAHQIGYVYADIHGLRKQGCTGCGFRIEGQASEIGNMHEIHRAHVAEVLEKHMQEARAQELEAAAAEYGEIYNQPQPNYYAPGHVIRALINRANEIRKDTTNGR